MTKPNVLNYAGNIANAPQKALDTMQETGAKFITWINSSNNHRFVATLNYVQVKAHNKKVGWRNAVALPENEIKDLGFDLCTDEILFEMDACGSDEITIKEGFGSEIVVTRDSLDVDLAIDGATNEMAVQMLTSNFIYGPAANNMHGNIFDAVSAGAISEKEADLYIKSTKAVMGGYRTSVEFKQEIQFKLDAFFKRDEIDYSDFEKKCRELSGDKFVTVCAPDLFKRGRHCYYTEKGETIHVDFVSRFESLNKK